MFLSEQGSAVPVGLGAGTVQLLWGGGKGAGVADTELPDDPATPPLHVPQGTEHRCPDRSCMSPGNSSTVLGAQKVEMTHMSAGGQVEQPTGVRPHRGRALGPEKDSHGPLGRYAPCGFAHVNCVGQAGAQTRGAQGRLPRTEGRREWGVTA